MVCPPLSPSIGGRSGTISSWCNGDGNTYKVSKWLDGAAGTAWKISCYMASALGGTADGQLTTDYYVQALNNASGGAGGFRVLHQIRQPSTTMTAVSGATPRWLCGPQLRIADQRAKLDRERQLARLAVARGAYVTDGSPLMVMAIMPGLRFRAGMRGVVGRVRCYLVLYQAKASIGVAGTPILTSPVGRT